MERWHIPFLGLVEIPRCLTDFEIERFFTLTEAEIRELADPRKTPSLQVAAAIQLGFVRLSGRTLSRVKMVPTKVLNHIGRQLKVTAPSIASLRALYRKRERTLWDHQAWAIKAAGFQTLANRQQRVLLSRLKERAEEADRIDELIRFAREWFYDRKILLPGDRPLRDLARRALAHTEHGLYEMMRAQIPETQCQRLFNEMFKRREREGVSVLEWLMTPPGKRSKKELSARFERIDYLKSLGVDKIALADIPYEKLQSLAQAMRTRRPSRFRDIQEPRRTLELVAFLRVTLVQATDTAIQLVSWRTLDFVRHAKHAAEEGLRAELASRAQILERIKQVAFDSSLSDADCRAQVQTLLGSPALTLPVGRSAAIRDHLCSQSRRIRPLLHTLASLDIGARSDEPVVATLKRLNQYYAEGTTALPTDHGCKVSKAWNAIVEGEDRRRALAAMEAATLIGIRKAFRRGSAWVDHSVSYRDPDRILIPPPEWAKTRKRRYDQLSMPESADLFLKRVLASLEAGLASVGEAVAQGRLRIEDGSVHMPAMQAAPEPEGLKPYRSRLFTAIKATQLPEVLLEVDSDTRFSWLLLGRAPDNEQELLALYGALLAHGTALEATGVAKMIPGLAEERIRKSMRHLESEDRMEEASRVVLEYQRRHGVIQYWGVANLASSDMLALDASRNLVNARIDPRRRTFGFGTYTHLLDQWSMVYDQLVVLLERQAGVAIEGAIRQRDVKIERLSVDTHGYTDFAMAIARILRFDLCPRLKTLKERRLDVPRGVKVPPALEAIIDRDVSPRAIRKGYDGLVRVAASIDCGYTSAVLALDRYGSDARGDSVYKAGVHLGRMLRTIFLCDYLTNAVFEREIRRILSRGEAVHVLQRAIHSEPLPHARGRRREELIAVSGSLRLLTNICLAWTTHRIEAALVADATLQQPALLAHVSPAQPGLINFRGIFQFPFAAYRERLLAPAPVRAGSERREH